MRAIIGSVLVAALAVATAAAQDDAVKKEQEKLQGKWVVESFQVGDKTLDRFKGLVYRFDGEKLFTTLPGQKEVEGSYKLDPKADPKAIDLFTHRADGGKTTTPAIYRLDGDTLTVCSGVTKTITDEKGKVTDMPGKRPTKFEATKDGGLIVMKREKK